LRHTDKNYSGFSLVEVLLSISLFAIIVTLIIGGLIYTRESSSLSNEQTKALELSREGAEITRSIRDQDFSLLQNGTYGIELISNIYQLDSQPDQIDQYTREIVISDYSANTKRIISRVYWQKGDIEESLSTELLLTNWQDIVSADWVFPQLNSSLDLQGSANAIDSVHDADHLYILRSGDIYDLAIVDVTNPTAPIIEAEVNISDTATSLFLDDDYLYITTSNDTAELLIFDVSIKTNPIQISTVDLIGSPDAIAISKSGNILSILREYSLSEAEIQLIDVSDNTLPVLNDSYQIDGITKSITITDNQVIVSTEDDTKELIILDILDPNNIGLDEEIDLQGNLYADLLNIEGDTLFLTREGGDVEVYDISDLSSPVLKDSHLYGSLIYDIQLSGNYLFIGGDKIDEELTIIDITDIATLIEVGKLDLPGRGYAIEVLTNVAYIMTQTDEEVFIVDSQ
jgi:Tfp pilus assembly protein PilV